MPPGWSGKVSWGSFGGVLGGLGGVLGRLGGVLGGSWGVLGAKACRGTPGWTPQREAKLTQVDPSWTQVAVMLGPSWPKLGSRCL